MQAGKSCERGVGCSCRSKEGCLGGRLGGQVEGLRAAACARLLACGPVRGGKRHDLT